MKVVETLEESQRAYGSGYYAEKLEQGLVFQDLVTRELYKRGIVIVGYASRHFQNDHGENILGAEIRRDGHFRKTGNLYIEVAEKSHPDVSEYTSSGIERNDGSWLFIIGDEHDIWIFSTKQLCLLVHKREWRQVKKPTSIGYLCPMEDAERYCLRKITITES